MSLGLFRLPGHLSNHSTELARWQSRFGNPPIVLNLRWLPCYPPLASYHSPTAKTRSWAANSHHSGALPHGMLEHNQFSLTDAPTFWVECALRTTASLKPPTFRFQGQAAKSTCGTRVNARQTTGALTCVVPCVRPREQPSMRRPRLRVKQPFADSGSAERHHPFNRSIATIVLLFTHLVGHSMNQPMPFDLKTPNIAGSLGLSSSGRLAASTLHLDASSSCQALLPQKL